MKTVKLESFANAADLVDAVVNEGEEAIILVGERPVARLSPIAPSDVTAMLARRDARQASDQPGDFDWRAARDAGRA